MNIKKNINALKTLGEYIEQGGPELQAIIETTRNENAWFTKESTTKALEGVAFMIKEAKLNKWVAQYSINNNAPQNIGIIMAGNIPLVGFHDLITVLVSGNNAMIKRSSQDSILITHLVEKLIELEAGFKDRIQFVDKLNNIDAIIATGSDNTSRYFDYYFAKYPHIIRKNRTSCAILNGNETQDNINTLGNDIFQYYGLGCRNVSKIYIPENYDIVNFLDGLSKHSDIIQNHKYHNNYDYNKSIFLVNKVQHYDNGFLLLTESQNLVSPLAVLYFEHYNSTNQLEKVITSNREKIQCIVSDDAWYPGSITFGMAQEPELWDYADNIDTMKFLLSLN